MFVKIKNPQRGAYLTRRLRYICRRRATRGLVELLANQLPVDAVDDTGVAALSRDPVVLAPRAVAVLLPALPASVLRLDLGVVALGATVRTDRVAAGALARHAASHVAGSTQRLRRLEVLRLLHLLERQGDAALLHEGEEADQVGLGRVVLRARLIGEVDLHAALPQEEVVGGIDLVLDGHDERGSVGQGQNVLPRSVIGTVSMN